MLELAPLGEDEAGTIMRALLHPCEGGPPAALVEAACTYAGGNPLYAIAYQAAGGYNAPYTLGNGVPTNDGVHQAVPWSYGRAGYVPQGYPNARTLRLKFQYRM